MDAELLGEGARVDAVHGRHTVLLEPLRAAQPGARSVHDGYYLMVNARWAKIVHGTAPQGLARDGGARAPATASCQNSNATEHGSSLDK